MSSFDFERRVREVIETGRVPSISVAWQCAGGNVERFAAGAARLSPETQASPETRYAWFSVTKLFTATAVLQLVEAGRIGLDDPVSRHVAALPGLTPSPTARQLLSHTSGLANPIPLRWIHLADECGPGLEDMTRRLLDRHGKLRSAPGTRYRYSNLGYLVLGLLIQRVSGLAFEEYVERHVLEPLGTTSTGFSASPGTASGHSRAWSLMDITARVLLDKKYFGPVTRGFSELERLEVDGAPYGGLIGTASDMLRLGHALLQAGMLDGEKILDASLARLALEPARTASGPLSSMGLGWHLAEIGGEPYAYHIGGGAGFRSELGIYPRLGHAIAIVGNETSFDTTAFTRTMARPR